jgi:hypothetical protein
MFRRRFRLAERPPASGGSGARRALAAQFGGELVGVHPRRVVGRHHLVPLDLDPIGLLGIEDDRQVGAGLRPLFRSGP